MTASNQTYRCPNCGGIVTYDVGRALFACSQCGSTFTPQATPSGDPGAGSGDPDAGTSPPASSTGGATTPQGPRSPAYGAALGDPDAGTSPPASSTGDAATPATTALAAYHCDGCGAEIVAPSATDITVRCHYCHNPVVLMPEISGDYAPDAIVPFTVTREQAIDSFRRFTRRHRFTRRAFFDEANIDKLTGVYLPYFAIDAYLDGRFTAEAEQRRSFHTHDATVTEHRVYQLRRHTSLFIDDYAVEALAEAISAKIVNCIQPFDLTRLIAFDYRYLVGFQAERRDIGAEQLEGRIHADFASIATRVMTRDLRALGYSSVSAPVTRALTTTREERKYCLLPVWLFTYLDRDKGKTYYYAVNGQTGEASGILPISGLAASLTAAGIVLAGWAAILGVLWGVG